MWGLTIKSKSYFAWKTLTFDRRVQYDNYANTYTLVHNGRKKILSPMKEVSPIKKSDEAQPKKGVYYASIWKGEHEK